MKPSEPRNLLPPRWAEKLLIWLHPTDTIEEVQGDLEELYTFWHQEHGITYANSRYLFSLLSVLPPFVKRRQRRKEFSQPSLIHPAMIKSYLKIAFRSLQKNRLYSFINLMGLTLGLGVSITLFWIVSFEYSFDRYHAKSDRIYRVRSTDKFGDQQSHVHQGVIRALNTQFSEVEKADNFYGFTPTDIKVGNEVFSQKNIFFTSPAMLEMLDVQWIKGSSESLKAPGQVVIDDETAAKLFKGDALGKNFRYNNQTDLTVSGVFKKVPLNTEFPIQMVISWETLKQMQSEYKNEDNWGGGDSMNQGFVLLKKGALPERVSSGLTTLVKKHSDESKIASYELQPLSEMHFDTSKDPFSYSMPKWVLYTLASIGFFLIFIACINFINLATVQAIQRGREIAMRKVLGSGKGQLIGQFFGETALLVFAAILAGSLLATELIKYSAELLNTQVAQSQVWGLSTIVFLFLLGVGVTFLAGFYPAIVLSGFDPINALRGRPSVPVNGAISLRSSLVVLQFVIAQVLVICTLLAMKQIRYFYETDLGFAKTGIVTVAMHDRTSILRERFRQQLSKYPEVKGVAFGLTTPASNRNHWWGVIRHRNLPNGEETFRIQHVDTNYFDFFHIPLLAGRGLISSDTTTGSKTAFENTNVMINEKAARDMGYKDLGKTIGEKLKFWGVQCTVVGVVKDYQSEDLKSKLTPHVYVYATWNFQLASIRVDRNQRKAALEHIGKEWKLLFPNNYYNPRFLEDDISKFYDSERKLSNFLQLFAGVGILIGSLGLFGLVSFVVTQRTKEIGVRKVLGATITSIIQLLSLDFLKLVVIAFIIASPLAWYMMKRFLEEYENKIDIQWWVFALGGLLSTGIALLTVSFQSVKAALMNPVRSLKSE